jgi:ATP-dependent protease HslVU (ClpYQ) peptidase subunit
MTVIAVRDGVVATDSRIALDDSVSTCQKLFKIGQMVLGFAGESGGSLCLLRALRDGKGADPEELKGGWALGICKKRGIVYFDQALEPEILTSAYFAIGSGGAHAMGAMYRKATAVEAVRAAIALNANCGGPVQWARAAETRKKA